MAKSVFEIKDLDLRPQPAAEESPAPSEEDPGENQAEQPEQKEAPPPIPMPVFEYLRQEMEGPVYFNVEEGRIERTGAEIAVEMAMRMDMPQGRINMKSSMKMQMQMDLAEVRREEVKTEEKPQQDTPRSEEGDSAPVP
jgi:hypothetical protein